MSQQTQTESETDVGTGSRLMDWQAGAIGGFIGGIVMGGIIWMMNPKTIAGAIAGLYTLQGSPVAGWIAHLIHSIILGVIFAVTVSAALTRYADSLAPSAGLGLVWGFVLWVVAAGIVMPVWLQVVGFPTPPPLPNWTLPGSLIPHLVYGVILGGLYPFLRG
jgi:uncharacterized membrane protein YagU involved in acid resistance